MDLKKLAPLHTLSRLLPRRHAIHGRAEDLSCQPFFIVGSGRNGSTLFSAMLNHHPQILLPTEQWRFPNMILKYRFYNFLPWKELVSLVIGEIAAANASLEWNVNFNHTLAELQYLPKSHRSLQKILDCIYIAYGKQHAESFSIWGEKSPKNTPLIRYIYPVYPQSKYLFLIRDGRDVARSWLIKNESKDIRWIAESWNESIEIYDWLKQRLPAENLMTVRYEELVTETENVLTQVCQFLGFDFAPSMLAFQDYSVKISNEKVFQHFKQLKKPANPSSIGKWEEFFKGADRDLIMKLIGPNLRRFAYEN
jgi:protein-tyrosine sulfotransferase